MGDMPNDHIHDTLDRIAAAVEPADPSLACEIDCVAYAFRRIDARKAPVQAALDEVAEALDGTALAMEVDRVADDLKGGGARAAGLDDVDDRNVQNLVKQARSLAKARGKLPASNTDSWDRLSDMLANVIRKIEKATGIKYRDIERQL